jgi:hypothetical protein
MTPATDLVPDLTGTKPAPLKIPSSFHFALLSYILSSHEIPIYCLFFTGRRFFVTFIYTHNYKKPLAPEPPSNRLGRHSTIRTIIRNRWAAIATGPEITRHQRRDR